ncbi:Transcriptional regulatory protein moc3 [Talaromyces islandicus]|uniref:Transcriptional regulatory protein moc3 n=1 Tax=Talaromyces islandicus TaxID=28573 RepID=A0A0U1LZ86_TALIS|nr:Transcriptional regulatory protein moc3 [Talaromyces islandicus]
MRGVKKSRNGCATCKSKRLKCDESKPSCGRCVRLGIKCPGYSRSLRWVTKHETLENNTGASSLSPSSRASPRPAETIAQASEPGQADSAADNVLLLSDVGTPLDIDQWDRQMNSTLPELGQLDTLEFPAEPIMGGSSRLSDIDPSSPNTNVFPDLSLPETLLHEESALQISPILTRSSSDQLRILPSLRRSLEDPSSTLVEYYFKEVAGLFSSYDSHMNPFRTTVSRLWTSSSVLYRTLQSMAAATLVDDFPQFGAVGHKMRLEAISILEKQTSLDDKSLLAILMLGQTASWHNANDLGVSFFNLLRSHLNAISADGSGGNALLTNRNNFQFFEEALVYWEMLLSYVADHGTLTPSTNPDLYPSTDAILTQRVPHPWTGIARDTQFAVHEVGRLVRRERNRMRSKRFTSRGDIAQAQRAIEEAQELEQRLLSLSHPTELEVLNPGDDDTPVWHLLAMAEVYRYTGLLQLYRVFPDLLQARICSEERVDPFSNAGDVLQFDIETSNILPVSRAAQDEWLTRFALAAMSKLKTIPFESRTRCLQPFLLVAPSSELRLPPVNEPLEMPDGDYTLNLSAHAIDVSRTRKFILGRLSSLLHVLPPKPIHICFGLVKEVWRRMDAGEPDVFWMDVMIERGWETTMG